MSYQALVCRLTNIRKHPNADKVLLANAGGGYQVVVGLDQKEGDLGVFFGPDGKLSHNHLMANKLYSTDPTTGEKMGGYFGKNGRVRAQKFRGEISEGFWQEAKAFDWCGGLNLKEGATFTDLNGQRICEKYYTPATFKAMNQKVNKPKIKGAYKRLIRAPWYRKIYLIFWFLYVVIKEKLSTNKKTDLSLFKEHFDTKQLRDHIKEIPEGAIIYLSEKCHGTSGRTARLKISTTYKGPLGWFYRLIKKPTWQHVSGTRRTIMDPNHKGGYYINTRFRQIIHEKIKEIGLYKGETLYYEIVGYSDTGSPLMGVYHPEDKTMKKLFGENITFSYGCNPEGNGFPDQYNIFIYRITVTNEDGKVTELSWPQVEERCEKLGVKTVPLFKTILHENSEKLLNDCRAFADGKSTLDDKHIREGVVIRIEHKDLATNYKWKGWHFCELENIKKNSEDYVDLEEIS